MSKKASKIRTIPEQLAEAIGKSMGIKAKPAAKPAAKDTGLGPNDKFPFGIKLADAKGNISWERFKTAAERDKRMASVKGGKRVDFVLDTAKPAAAIQPAAAQPAAKPAAAAQPAAKPDSFKIHVNNTGRVCFGKDATARLGSWENKHMAMAIDEKGLIRIDLAKPAADTIPVKNGSGRPYISATKRLKPLGFDGSRPYDISDAKPYGTAGFEFRLI